MVLVPKKDRSYRFYVDYRRLNSITQKDVHPPPCIDDIGYWQIGLNAESATKSAFATHRGLHKFTKMPFSMCNAPATFQKLMEVDLAGLIWKSCFAYIDDVLVCSHLRNTLNISVKCSVDCIQPDYA